MAETQRQLQKRKTREKILEVALTKLAVTGLTQTKTADIAKAAGISHGTLFAHFPTQEELLIAVIEKFGTDLAAKLHASAHSKNSLQETLEEHVQALTEHEAFYARLIMERRLLPDAVQHTVVAIQSAISFHIAQAADKEIKENSILNIPLHMIFNTWIGLLHYYLTNSDLFTSAGGSVLDRYGGELINIFMQMISRKI